MITLDDISTAFHVLEGPDLLDVDELRDEMSECVELYRRPIKLLEDPALENLEDADQLLHSLMAERRECMEAAQSVTSSVAITPHPVDPR